MNILKNVSNSLIGVVAILCLTNVALAEDVNVINAEYINGGIGQEEADDIRAQAGGYNLHIYLSEGIQGHALTDVPVTIIDQKGNVKLDFLNSGPMLFLKLEKGSYKISAEHNGITMLRKVLITKQRGVNIYLNWKSTAANSDDSLLKTNSVSEN